MSKNNSAKGIGITEPQYPVKKKYSWVVFYLFFFSFLLIADVEQTNGLVWTVYKNTKGALELKTAFGKIILAYSGDSLSVNHITLKGPGSDNKKCAYLLEGFDSDWIMVNSIPYKIYESLKAGQYKLNIKAINTANAGFEKAHTLKIIVLPSRVSTPYTYLFYGAMLVLVLTIFFWWKRKFIIMKQKEESVIEETKLRAEEAEFQASVAKAKARAVSEESKRKSIELEEARKFQLSMLPKKIPYLSHLEVAASMKTASEVGGDYYDFKVRNEENGALVVLCGDATGHGLKAGTMISVIKTLFVSEEFGSEKDINDFFIKCNDTIKKVGLRHLQMALTFLKIENNMVTVSSAGMPPAFVFRKENKIIETVVLKGPPLGAIKKIPYHYDYINMESGDAILLLTDGLPELFNREGKMFGYDRIGECLKKAGEKSAEEILSYLNNCAEKWLNYKPLDDDMTMVIIKFN